LALQLKLDCKHRGLIQFTILAKQKLTKHPIAFSGHSCSHFSSVFESKVKQMRNLWSIESVVISY